MATPERNHSTRKIVELLAAPSFGYDSLVALIRATSATTTPGRAIQAIRKRAKQLQETDMPQSRALDVVATTFDILEPPLRVHDEPIPDHVADHASGMSISFTEAAEQHAAALESPAQRIAREISGAASEQVTKIANDMPPSNGDA
jgi:cell division septum initiation protein DivIVA